MADDIKRLDIGYWEGINTLVEPILSKKTEPDFVQNGRSVKVGSIEKRAGFTQVGNSLSPQANYGLFFFQDNGIIGKHLYRVVSIAGVPQIYYLTTSDTWVSLGGSALFTLGDATTTFNITHSGTTFTYTFTGVGTDPNIITRVKIGDSLMLAAQGFLAANNGTFTVTAVASNAFSVVNAAGVDQTGVTIGTGYIIFLSGSCSTAIAENCCFIANGVDNNRYITDTGTSIIDSTSTSGHLYNSPRASLINYYKDKLYVADFWNGTIRNKNSVMMSSQPVGKVSLVEGDQATGTTSLAVTDTKYIRASDSLDVYRGGTKITTLTVTGKGSYKLTVTATTVDLLSADELWVANTYTGARVFRWADNPASGTDVSQYDTFKLPAGGSSEIKMITNIGDVMVLSNNDNFSVWNNSNLRTFDSKIGCVSKRGFVKNNNMLFFVNYSGIYASDGNEPKLMSSKVEAYITGATKAGLENAVAGKKGLSVLFYIGTVTLYDPEGGEAEKTLTDVVLEYNIRQENWFVHTGIPIEQFETFIDSADPNRLVFANKTNHKIYELFSGTSDDGADIPFVVTTSDITLATAFNNISYPRWMAVEVSTGSVVKCFVSFDREQFFELHGDSRKGCTVVQFQTQEADERYARCRRIRVSIREISKNPCKLSRLAIQYTESPVESEIYHR